MKKILWIKELINYNKITIYTNNLASKTAIENREINKKIKYIDIRIYFNKINIDKKIVKLEYIDIINMQTDTLTKNHGTKILNFINKIFYK